MSEKSTPTSVLPAPLRETTLAYLGTVFYGIDLTKKYIAAPVRRYAGRIARVRFPKRFSIAVPHRGRRHAH